MIPKKHPELFGYRSVRGLGVGALAILTLERVLGKPHRNELLASDRLLGPPNVPLLRAVWSLLDWMVFGVS